MGALKFAAKKILGIILTGVGILFGVAFWIGGLANEETRTYTTIIGLVILVLGIVFGMYFWRSADRHV